MNQNKTNIKNFNLVSQKQTELLSALTDYAKAEKILKDASRKFQTFTNNCSNIERANLFDISHEKYFETPTFGEKKKIKYLVDGGMARIRNELLIELKENKNKRKFKNTSSNDISNIETFPKSSLISSKANGRNPHIKQELSSTSSKIFPISKIEVPCDEDTERKKNRIARQLHKNNPTNLPNINTPIKPQFHHKQLHETPCKTSHLNPPPHHCHTQLKNQENHIYQPPLNNLILTSSLLKPFYFSVNNQHNAMAHHPPNTTYVRGVNGKLIPLIQFDSFKTETRIDELIEGLDKNQKTPQKVKFSSETFENLNKTSKNIQKSFENISETKTTTTKTISLFYNKASQTSNNIDKAIGTYDKATTDLEKIKNDKNNNEDGKDCKDTTKIDGNSSPNNHNYDNPKLEIDMNINPCIDIITNYEDKNSTGNDEINIEVNDEIDVISDIELIGKVYIKNGEATDDMKTVLKEDGGINGLSDANANEKHNGDKSEDIADNNMNINDNKKNTGADDGSNDKNSDDGKNNKDENKENSKGGSDEINNSEDHGNINGNKEANGEYRLENEQNGNSLELNDGKNIGGNESLCDINNNRNNDNIFEDNANDNNDINTILNGMIDNTDAVDTNNNTNKTKNGKLYRGIDPKIGKSNDENRAFESKSSFKKTGFLEVAPGRKVDEKMKLTGEDVKWSKEMLLKVFKIALDNKPKEKSNKSTNTQKIDLNELTHNSGEKKVGKNYVKNSDELDVGGFCEVNENKHAHEIADSDENLEEKATKNDNNENINAARRKSESRKALTMENDLKEKASSPPVYRKSDNIANEKKSLSNTSDINKKEISKTDSNGGTQEFKNVAIALSVRKSVKPPKQSFEPPREKALTQETLKDIELLKDTFKETVLKESFKTAETFEKFIEEEELLKKSFKNSELLKKSFKNSEPLQESLKESSNDISDLDEITESNESFNKKLECSVSEVCSTVCDSISEGQWLLSSGSDIDIDVIQNKEDGEVIWLPKETHASG